MKKKLKLVVMAMCMSPAAFAQEVDTLQTTQSGLQDEQAFTFTEAQLGEDDDMSQNVTIISSNNNIYASQVGFLFSPMRFRYRAFNQKYNEIYINGAPMNDMESGQFRYSLVGGLNNQTRGVEHSLPFEVNNFSMSAMAGSNNYDFRPSHFATGHRATISAANRNYTLRGMYTYNTGLMENGWAFSANLTYRFADTKTSYIEGTFYNSLSYFLGIEKVINDKHSLALVTWGNPTERSTQGAATDESYWLANSNYYNPYWGYQNGKVRNSRVVTDFSPSVLLTWDWKINQTMKLTTSVFGKYSKYKGTKLNYNNADNPQPDYWKNLPSSYFDVWDMTDDINRTQQGYYDFYTTRDYLMGSKAARQIDFDRLYYMNKQANAQGADAMYFIQAKNINNLNLALASTLKTDLSKFSSLNLGIQLGTNKGMHFQTMEDLLGATIYHNINTYALGNYGAHQKEIQYDLNNPNAEVREGDKFGYNYNIFVSKASAWGNYTYKRGRLQTFLAARIGGTQMQREGLMRNGLAPENSYGKGGTARFLDGGGKVGLNFNLGAGSTILLGAGYEWRAPQANTAFVSPEINNDFVNNLKNERIFSAEVGYNFQNAWLKANVNGYYSRVTNGTDWQNFYFDDINSFSYVSMTNIKKAYYGVEVGARFRLTSYLDLKAIGTWSEAKNTNNANVRYMNSTKGVYYDDIVMNKNMREAGTPLSAYSLGLSYHANGWYIDLNGNYYHRIYLSYSPSYRYQKTLTTMGSVDNNGEYIVPDQARGNGGFMLDASIGKSLRLKKGRSLSINLMLTNLLNNTHIVTGGYEQSRSDYTVKDDGSLNNVRAYKFSLNPKKYYAYGINGMLNIAYKF
ncbi:MAG: TonB-dependent receptor [Prevotella sp.]|nr:TonB-dependent receptor [Prevotella sp.]